MPPDFIRFQGRYRYSTPAALDRAIVAARSQLEDDDVGSLRFFLKESPSSLRVDVFVPAIADDVQFAASNVFQALARDAIEGAVVARRNNRAVDFFACGDDD